METGPCGICHGDMRRGGRGGGDAVFTAECSHQFHFHCISGTVARGRIACPLCHARWREFPSFRAGNDGAAAPPGASAEVQPFFRPVEPRVFDDDEPLVQAPRAPLDLVTVLDVSGSMVGNKLALLKQAMGFVIDNLGPGDRLCVISFSSGASRLMRLARMTDGGKAHAKRAVESLSARGGTNIGAALRKAAKVLDERLYRNAVESVILLSDGQDTYTVPPRGGHDRDANYDALVPLSLVRTEGGGRSPPVHTFGFGKDHDAAAMHTIAEATGGTFSFIENEAAIQDGFAQCIGGLLSVAVQELRLDVACVDTGVRVTAVKSGRYKSHIDEDGRAAKVDVGELYADEERSFLLFVVVPRAPAWDDVTHLIEVSCSYRDMETGRTTSVAGDEEAVVLRPPEVGVAERSVEVDRELVRVEAIDDIALARAAAERGEYAEAAEILRSRQRAVARSAAARAGDAMCAALSGELREMRARVADRRRYELSGRAYVLAGLSSHAQQRATSRQMSGEVAPPPRHGGGGSSALPTGITVSYVTPAMLDMLDRERDPCVICLREIAGGQAIFTAECSHTFHNRCIARNVAHGRRVCPLCNARWRDVPAPSSSAAAEPDDDDEPLLYADDDPVEPAGGQDGEQAAEAAATGGDAAAALVIKAHCEYPAVARDASSKAVGAAAGDAQRAPLDLVTVLDVSWSMEGRKLELVKRAISFVIDNLGHADRLCVVTFSTEASRRTPLLRMSEVGKATAKRTVESLVANGSTDVGQGLRVAARVLGDRRHRNPVSSIILLSGQDTRDPCAICLREIACGQAIFTAECSHTFHNRCIARNVAHGRRVCPLCNARWRDVPAPSSSAAAEPDDDDEPLLYADDDPVEPAGEQAAAAATDGDAAAGLVVKVHCEYPAVARDASRDNFAVLVHAKAVGAAAPAEAASRAPLDLVTVLDVSGSMAGTKLALVKKAMGFVIDNLGPADRLCVVSFSEEAKRRTRLLRMSEDGKARAKHAIESLVAYSATNIGDGLRVAARVLGDRRHKNAVSSVILLSDGQDTFVVPRRGNGLSYMDLVPPSFAFSGSAGRLAPIHTFGFGTDHDAAAMNTIAEATGGTFSFIENEAAIQDSFAQCIGGLLSVAVQDARIAVACSSPGVLVREIKSGRYESRVDADNRAASVDVGELYADEERRFLLFINVPITEATEDATHLIKLSCTYRDTVTGRTIDVAGEDAVVQRPLEVSAADKEVSMEVERERVRVEATEDITIARAAAERGDHADAARTLQLRRQAVERSAPGLAGDLMCEALADELCELEEEAEDATRYERVGRARMLAGISSHGLQRASGTMHLKVGLVSSSRRLESARLGNRERERERERERLYATPAMGLMISKSRSSRDEPPVAAQQQQKRPGSGGDEQSEKKKKNED
uniref:RING-type E3 ubiquitin transferase n=1 Tax=Oryza punctata TaxID=4537 RepID=A0A0E0M8F7_ORYPU